MKAVGHHMWTMVPLKYDQQHGGNCICMKKLSTVASIRALPCTVMCSKMQSLLAQCKYCCKCLVACFYKSKTLTKCLYSVSKSFHNSRLLHYAMCLGVSGHRFKPSINYTIEIVAFLIKLL